MKAMPGTSLMLMAAGVILAMPGGTVPAGRNPSMVTAMPTVVGNSTVYEFKVTAPGGETIKEFHILPMPDSALRPYGTPQNATGSGGPWVASKSSSGFNWKTNGGSGLTSNHSITFKVTAGNQFTDQPVMWVTTSDVNNNPTDGQVDHGPQGGQTPPDMEARGPTSSLSVGPAAGPPHISSTHALALETSLGGFTYVIHKMSAEPSEFLLDAEFSTFMENNRVPSRWNLTFNGFTGTVNDAGNGSASIKVPNDASLIGQSIWLVLECSEKGSSETTRSAPLKVTFVE